MSAFHQWLIVWHWLVIHNFWQAVVSWCVLTTLTVAAGWLPWRRHRVTQRKIADRLDSDTPGGITDVIDAIRELPGSDKGGSGASHR